MPPDLVIFHIFVKNNKQTKNPDKSNLRDWKGVYFGSQFGGYHPSWEEGTAAAVWGSWSHGPQSGIRERWTLVLSPLSPFSSVWDPNPLGGTTHHQLSPSSPVKCFWNHPQTLRGVSMTILSLVKSTLKVNCHTSSHLKIFSCRQIQHQG